MVREHFFLGTSVQTRTLDITCLRNKRIVKTVKKVNGCKENLYLYCPLKAGIVR